MNGSKQDENHSQGEFDRMTNLTGIDMTGEELSAGPGVSLGASNTPKYFQMEYDKDYFVRVVSGFLPYLSYYRTNGASLISPATLSLSQAIQTPNGVVQQRIYKKEDGSDYTAEECHCPMMDANNNPQTRYGTNVVDWQEVQSNPDGPHNIYILSGGKSIFKHFLHFKNAMRDYPVFDPDRGPIWRIKKLKEGGRTNYLVEPMDPAPLPPALRAQVQHVKEKPGDPGVWKLKEEFHPFYCSEKQAIDNGHNPIFLKKAQEQSQQHSFGVDIPAQPPVAPGQPIAPVQTAPAQPATPAPAAPIAPQPTAPAPAQPAPAQPVASMAPAQAGPVATTVQPAAEPVSSFQPAPAAPVAAMAAQGQVAPAASSEPLDQNYWDSKFADFEED